MHGNKNAEESVDADINAKLEMVIVMLMKQRMSWESLVVIDVTGLIFHNHSRTRVRIIVINNKIVKLYLKKYYRKS